MTSEEPDAERVLILAPHGRDAVIAAGILAERKLEACICADVDDLLAGIDQGAGLAMVVEEALHSAELTGLSAWMDTQPPWSDFPFVLLARRGGGLERNPGAARLNAALGNVTFLERPFHPTTLLSVVETALRGRRRQYEARQRIEAIREAESQLERRVAERTAELEAANRELASQIIERERIETALRQAQRLEAVGQLTSGVAHDFNNLLTVVLGNARQLRRAYGDPGISRRLEMIEQAAERGAKLTAQMLAFSRRQKLEPRPVDLNGAVAAMRDLLQSTMGGSIRLETRLAQDLWPAMIDPTQIELVVLNLAINARDAMAVGGTLTVETANVTVAAPRRPEEPIAGDYVMVAVGDNGSGMDDAVLARVFEPFFTTKEVGKGSGLGLSQVFGLAKQSGGGVRIDTALGKGTTVRVYLPRADNVPSADTAAARSMRRLPEILVLLVDDDDAVREVTSGLLGDLGCRVVEAGSGGAALEVLGAEPGIDLVLVDYAMPGMNGAEVAREIRARRPRLPVLFATGYADTIDLAGTTDEQIVHKPFTIDELAEKLTGALALSV